MTKRVVLHCKRLLLVAVGWVAVAVSVLGQGATAGAKTPAFDVAAIKLNKAGRGTMMMGAADGYTVTNASLKMLLTDAYGLKTDNLISGLPGWADSARFDIKAKMDEDTVIALKKLPMEAAWEQHKLMMQSLLEDRFQLKVHHVSKQLSIYELVIAKGGFKLKGADPNNTYPNGIKGPDGASRPSMMTIYPTQLKAQAVPVSALVNFLSRHLQTEVVDKTGLTGKYDLALRWSPDVSQALAMPDGRQDTGPSIFTALQEQLGLKLESTKGQVDTIVVDHIEMPSEN